MNNTQQYKVGEDMICPITKQHCDDECCTVGAECNLSGEGIYPMNNTQQAGEMNKEALVRILKAVSLIGFAEDTDFEYWVEGETHYLNADFAGVVIDAIYYDGNIFWIMNRDRDSSFQPLNPQSAAFKAWYKSPAVEAKAEEIVKEKFKEMYGDGWESAYTDQILEREMLKELYLAGHAEGQKAVEAKSAGVWVKATQYNVPKYLSHAHFRDSKTKETLSMGYVHSQIKQGYYINIEILDETTTSHEGEKGAVERNKEKWEKLNKAFDAILESLTKEDWEAWENRKSPASDVKKSKVKKISATTNFKMYLNKIMGEIPNDIHNELWDHLVECIAEKEHIIKYGT